LFLFAFPEVGVIGKDLGKSFEEGAAHIRRAAFNVDATNTPTSVD
jgi:hypothetical protein